MLQVPKKLLLTPHPKNVQNGSELNKKIYACNSITRIQSLHQQVLKQLFEPDPKTKNSPKRLKKSKNCPKLGQIKKRQGRSSNTKVDCLHKQVTVQLLNLSLTAKIALTQKGENTSYGAILKGLYSCASKTKVAYLH